MIQAHRFGQVVLFTGILLAGITEGAEPSGSIVALKAARLFDGKSKTLTTNGVVIVQGDKIIDAGANLSIPSGAQIIDLGDATLSPGFMDAHTHETAALRARLRFATFRRQDRKLLVDALLSDSSLEAIYRVFNVRDCLEIVAQDFNELRNEVFGKS